MNKKALVISAGLAAIICGLTIAGEFSYLQKKFRKKYASAVMACEEYKKNNLALSEEIDELRQQTEQAKALIQAKDKRIAALEKRTGSYALAGYGKRQYEEAVLRIPASGEKEDEEPEALTDTVSFAYSTRQNIGYMLGGFVSAFEAFIEERAQEQYRKDFGDYIAGLVAETDEAVSQRKEKMLANLQGRIDKATDDRQVELLRRRMEKIAGTNEEDLDGVLDYYQMLDDVRGLNELMEKYNISREELRQAGIEPPPRRDWGPDVMEIAFNLEDFTRIYEPIIEKEQRDEYREDFTSYLGELTTRPTDEQVLQRRDQMLARLLERYATASDREKRWIDRRIQGLQNSNLDYLRRRIQFDRLAELNQLIEKYDIPQSELREGGVLLSRSRSRFR